MNSESPHSGLYGLLSDVGCGVLAVVEDRVEFVNAALLSLFGLDGGAWQGRAALELLDAFTPTLIEQPAFGARSENDERTARPVTEDLRTVDGRTLECDYQPVGAGAHRRGYLVLMWDVTDERAEETGRTRRQRAEIVADAAHLAGKRLLQDE